MQLDVDVNPPAGIIKINNHLLANLSLDFYNTGVYAGTHTYRHLPYGNRYYAFCIVLHDFLSSLNFGQVIDIQTDRIRCI